MDDLLRGIDAAFARMDARSDRADALLREALDRLDRRQQPDVPLHRRGFGVMDEPPA
jgi:hypothetical protein